MPVLIDTHAHLYLPEFDQDIDIVIASAKQHGVEKIFLPNIDSESIAALINVSKKHSLCHPMMGLHPCSVTKDYESVLAQMKILFSQHKFYAVGETGIDLYWDKTLIEEQKLAFEIQVKWAKEMALPIVIHVRESFNEVFEVIDKHNDENLTGIFHCFTGNSEQAQHVMNYKGFKMGIGGVVTYKNSSLPQVLKNVPLEFIVLETDSPYLPPVPHRGKRNESSFILHTAQKLAEIYNLSIEEIGNITTKNAKQIFKL